MRHGAADDHPLFSGSQHNDSEPGSQQSLSRGGVGGAPRHADATSSTSRARKRLRGFSASQQASFEGPAANAAESNIAAVSPTSPASSSQQHQHQKQLQQQQQQQQEQQQQQQRQWMNHLGEQQQSQRNNGFAETDEEHEFHESDAEAAALSMAATAAYGNNTISSPHMALHTLNSNSTEGGTMVVANPQLPSPPTLSNIEEIADIVAAVQVSPAQPCTHTHVPCFRLFFDLCCNS
jgi:hypothetical protein